MTSVSDLLHSIHSENAVKTSEIFSTIMQEKCEAALQQRKIDLSKELIQGKK